jgi:hypothetical protein
MPANLTTLPHFSVSSAMSLPKSAGEPGSAVAPNPASRAFIWESARPALISWLSFSTISMGVLRGDYRWDFDPRGIHGSNPLSRDSRSEKQLRFALASHPQAGA